MLYFSQQDKGVHFWSVQFSFFLHIPAQTFSYDCYHMIKLSPTTFLKKEIKWKRSVQPSLFLFWFWFWFVLYYGTQNQPADLHVITVHSAFLLGFPYLTWYPRSVLRHLWPQGVLRHLWPLNRVEHTVCQVPCSDLFAVSPLFIPGLGDSTKFRVSKHHLYANDSQIYISRWATSSWITALYIHLPTQYLHLTSLKQPPQFYPQTCSSWWQLHPSSCLDQIPGSSLSPFFLLLPRSNPLAIPVGSV